MGDQSDDQWTDTRKYSCNNCLNPVAFSKDLISKSFVATAGRAAMFGKVMNVTVGEEFEKKLITGSYTIGDVYCAKCGQVLGWKYFRAHKPNQSYKEGNYILEFAKLVKGVSTSVFFSFHNPQDYY